MRLIICAVLAMGLTGGAALADTDAAEKEKQCQFQADVIGAVQQARLDRVGKAKVIPTLRAENPDWPESIDSALSPLVEYVWGFKRRDLKTADLAGDTKTTCLENWEQIQALQQSVTN